MKGDDEKIEIGKSVDLVDLYAVSEERRATEEQLSGIMRHSRDKRGHRGNPIPAAYATSFLWQVSDAVETKLERKSGALNLWHAIISNLVDGVLSI